MLKILPHIAQVKNAARNAMIYTKLGSVDEMIDAHAKLLDYCVFNPTTGLLAHNRYCNEQTLFSDVCSLKKSAFKKSPRIKYMKNVLAERLNELYPKTRKLREYIIENRRISLDKVRPCKGYSLLDKIKIFLR